MNLIQQAVRKLNESVSYEKPEQERADDTADPRAFIEALTTSTSKNTEVRTSVDDIKIIDSTPDHLEFNAVVHIKVYTDGSEVDSREVTLEYDMYSVAGGPPNQKQKLEMTLLDTKRSLKVNFRQRYDRVDEVEEVKSFLLDYVYQYVL